MLRARAGLLIWLFLYCSLVPAEAPKTWPVKVAPAREPASAKFSPELVKAAPAEFLDDYPACVLHAATKYRIEADGTVEITCQELIRLNARKGIEQVGEYKTITYAPAYETLTLHAARVHKAAGGTVDAGPRHVQLRDVNTDHLVYELSKNLIVSFPALEVGDAIEVHWTTRGRHPELRDHTFNRYAFGDPKKPVLRDELRVSLPKDKTLKFAPINGAPGPDVKEENGRTTYTWIAEKCKPPAEAQHKPPDDERPQVAFSTFATWQDVYEWEKANTAACGCTPEIRTIVADLTTGLTDPTDKARALTQWVRKRVRYVSAGEKHDLTPHPPGQVLADRCGDCKDTAHLLVVMLREAGLKAGLVTLSTRGDGQLTESVPSPMGNHAIARVTIDGKDHWIDMTLSYAGWDTLPFDDCDRVCYVLNEDGLELTRTPAMPARKNRAEAVTHVRVGPDGAARCTKTTTYHDNAAEDRRDELLGTPPGERRRLVADRLHETFDKLRLISLTLGPDSDDLDKPLQVTTEFEAEELFIGKEELSGQLIDAGGYSQLSSLHIDPDRETPLDLGEPFVTVQRLIVEAPPGFRFDAKPDDQRVKSAWGNFRRVVKFNTKTPRRLEIDFRSVLEKSLVESADLGAFQEFIEDVQVLQRVDVKLKTDSAVLLSAIDAQLDRGQFRAAREQSDRAKEIENPSAGLQERLAALATLAERHATLKKALPETEDAAIDGFVCAEYVFSRGAAPDQVAERLNAALKKSADFGPALALRGVLFLDRGKLTAAVRDAERAVTLSPQEFRGWYVRGRVRQERNQLGGLADLEKSAELSGRKDGAVLNALAAALHHAGRKAEALAAQKEAVKLQPENGEFAEQLRDMEPVAK